MKIQSSTASPTTAKIHTVLSNSEQTFITRLYQQAKQMFEKGASSLLDRKNIQLLSLAVGSGIAASTAAAFALQPVPLPTPSSLPERPGAPVTPPPYQKQPPSGSEPTPTPPLSPTPIVHPNTTGSPMNDLGMGLGVMLGMVATVVLLYHCCVGRKNSPSAGTSGGSSSAVGANGSPKRDSTETTPQPRPPVSLSSGDVSAVVDSSAPNLSDSAPQPQQAQRSPERLDEHDLSQTTTDVTDLERRPPMQLLNDEGEIVDSSVVSSFSSMILESAVDPVHEPQPLSSASSSDQVLSTDAAQTPNSEASDTTSESASNVSDPSAHPAHSGLSAVTERLSNGAASETMSPSGSAPDDNQLTPSLIKDRYLSSILYGQNTVSQSFNSERLVKSYEDLFYPKRDQHADQLFDQFALFHQKNLLEIFQEQTQVDVSKTCETNRDKSTLFINLAQAKDILNYATKEGFKLDHTFALSGSRGIVVCYLDYLRSCISSPDLKIVPDQLQCLITTLCKTWFQANQISSLLKGIVLQRIVGRGYSSPQNTKELQELLPRMNALIQQRRKESWEDFLARNLSSSNPSPVNLPSNTVVPEKFAVHNGISYLRHGSVVDLNQKGEISIVPEYELYLNRMAQEGIKVLYVNHESIDEQSSKVVADLENKGKFFYFSLPIDHLAIHPEKNRSWQEYFNQPTYQTMWIDGLVALMTKEGSRFRLPQNIQLDANIQQHIKRMAVSVRDKFFPDERTWDDHSRYLFLMIFYACIRKHFEEAMQVNTVAFARTDGKADLGSFVEEAFHYYSNKMEEDPVKLDALCLHAITPSLFQQEKCIPDDRCKLLVGVLDKIKNNIDKLNQPRWWKNL